MAGPLPLCASRNADTILKRKTGVALENTLLCFLFLLLFSCAVRRNLGCNIPCCRGRGASSPTKQNPHIQKSLCYFLKIISTRSYARKGITWDATSHVAGGVGRAAPQNKHTHFYARKAQFGIKRPAFTRGHGGDVSPHIQPHTLQTCAGFYFREGIVWA